MPLLSQLNEEEMDILMHKMNAMKANTDDQIVQQMVKRDLEKELAKISEEENFKMKNRYFVQKSKLDYADKKRMPVDESKLRDVLKN